MSQLSSSQIDRALCKIQGLNHFKRLADAHEITCELDLELLEKFCDFSFVSAPMLRYAVEHDELSQLQYEGIESPLAKMQLTINMPLSSMDKILVDEEVSVLCHESHTVNSIKTEYLLPDFFKFVQGKQEAVREQEKAAAEAQRQERLKAKAERKAALKNKKGGKKADTEVEASVAEANNAEAVSAAAAANDNAEAANGTEAHEVHPWIKEYQDLRASERRYAGRKVQVHLFEDWQQNSASVLWTLTVLQHHFMMPEDDGLPDMLRDVIVYEWFDKRSVEERQALGMSATLANMTIEDLYSSLRLSDVVIFPDGKSVMWYSLDAKGPVDVAELGIEGFGVDIDPPFMQNYATGIKHVFAGALEQHPSVKWYRELLKFEGLKDLVQSVHYTPSDNISPYSEDETSPHMIFINNGYLIFTMELTPEVNHVPENKVIEILVKETPDLSLEGVVAQLKRLKFEDFADYEQLCEDIVDTIVDPLVDMKNEQEAKRRARDEEYKTYTFKDPINRSEFTRAKLMRNFPLSIDRVVLSGENEIKFILQSDLFAFKDSDDDRYQGEGASLGIVHADAIVVSLELNGEGYDFSGIDLADCVQIPFGAHQNHDVDSYPEQGLSTLLSDLESPLPEGWKESWVQTVSEFELVQPESENKANRKGAANNKRKRKK